MSGARISLCFGCTLFVVGAAFSAMAQGTTPVSSATPVSNCAPQAPVKDVSLHLVYPAKAPLKNPVQVSVSVVGEQLRAHFVVNTPTLNAKKVLGPGQYPYMFDVVELFVSATGSKSHTPYYEFELSPYNQTFQVKIIDLKKPFVDGVEMGLDHSVQLRDGTWTADMSIPLKNLGWDGKPESIFGNAYAVFGKGPTRTYWSLSLPMEKKPNFHLPQYFSRLIPTKAPTDGLDTGICTAN